MGIRIGIGSLKIGQGSTGVDWSSYCTTLTDRFTTSPTLERKTLINNAMLSLETAGLFSKLDVLCLIGADAQASCQNWIKNGINAILYNSPTFLADRYFGGDAISKYISTGFNGTTSGQHFAQNSASYGIVYYAKATTGTYDGDKARVVMKSTDGVGWINNSPSGDLACGAGPGHLLIVRSASNLSTAYKNGVSSGTSSVASNAVFDDVIDLHRYATAYNNSKITAWYLGAALNGTEITALHVIIKTYLDAIGCTIL